MFKKLTIKKMGIFLLILLIVIQFFTIDKTTKPTDVSKDIIALTSANPEITTILKTSCYDCHSNQPVYPWYTNIAPLSWWIKHHINEGSQHLNFSEWGTYSKKRKNHKLDECAEMLIENEMPLTSYTIIHKEAKLTFDQKNLLLNWFYSLKEQ